MVFAYKYILHVHENFEMLEMFQLMKESSEKTRCGEIRKVTQGFPWVVESVRWY